MRTDGIKRWDMDWLTHINQLFMPMNTVITNELLVLIRYRHVMWQLIHAIYYVLTCLRTIGLYPPICQFFPMKIIPQL